VRCSDPVLALEIIEQGAALVDEHEEAAPGVIVLGVALECSVGMLIRSVRIATCTSGEPVSPDARALSLINVCLRSAVTDIVHFLSKN
jgi:hypothetical protein